MNKRGTLVELLLQKPAPLCHLLHYKFHMNWTLFNSGLHNGGQWLTTWATGRLMRCC